ncbi:MAG: hypothetical protein ABI612_03355 [Betaproteobacteria bacterium]
MLDDIPVFSTENFIARRIDLIRVNTGPIAYDPVLGWKLTDYFAPPINAVPVTIGDGGMRMNGNDERPIPTSATIAIGSSSTYGVGISNSDTWPAQLERILDEPVVNAGAEDWGMDQIILRAESVKRQFNPKTLIVALSDRDVPLNTYTAYRGGRKPYFVIDKGGLSLVTPRSTFSVACVATSKQSDSVIAYFLIKKLASLKERGTNVVLLLLYERDTIRSGQVPPYMGIIGSAARDFGLQVIDTLGELTTRIEGGTNSQRLWADPPTDSDPCGPRRRSWMSSNGQRVIASTLSSKVFGRPSGDNVAATENKVEIDHR